MVTPLLRTHFKAGHVVTHLPVSFLSYNTSTAIIQPLLSVSDTHTHAHTHIYIYLHRNTATVLLLCNFPQIPSLSCRAGLNVPLIIAVLVCSLAHMGVSRLDVADNESVKWVKKIWKDVENVKLKEEEKEKTKMKRYKSHIL